MNRKIVRALISVYDKTGLVDLGGALHRMNVEILSTGGSAKALAGSGIAVTEVSDFTGSPEILDGRVKTLHPKIHGGILAIRDRPEHRAQVTEHGLSYIDLVVVNLYPFLATIKRADLDPDLMIENIDIGGPSMIRAAAKNFRDVAVVVDPADYPRIIEELGARSGALSLETRLELCRKAFVHTSGYDAVIADALSERLALDEDGETLGVRPPSPMPARRTLALVKRRALRYGENPHQPAALYAFSGDAPGVADAQQLHGKELSFNNYLDLDAAWNLVSEFQDSACVIIKHTNPCGVGLGSDLREACAKALATDPVSAFGGIIAANRPVDGAAAGQMAQLFVEAIVAPGYTPEALEVLTRKKNIRLMRIEEVSRGPSAESEDFDLKRVTGGILFQVRDRGTMDNHAWQVVTKRGPTIDETEALAFAWLICKHVKSNAIVYARKDQLVGVGAGQMSRVDSVRLGAQKAVLPLAGTVLASDAFFPFRDGIDEAARAGVAAIIQPGGSVRDREVLDAADEHDLAMVFTGMRHFRH